MAKEHKKLYKAGKNWIVATLTATTITLLGGIGAYTVHADTTIESSQDVQTTSVNQTNQVDNSNDSVTTNQPVAVQSSQTAQNNQSVKGNQTNQTVPNSATAAADTSNSDSLDSNIYGTVQSSQNNNSNNSVVLNQPVTTQSNSTVKNSQPVQNTPTTETAFAATNSSDGLDPSIYGTVNVRDWYYQKDNNLIILTGYRTGYGVGYRGQYTGHIQDAGHIIVPNLNDFDNAGVKIGNATGVGISSELARSLAVQSLAFAISKTSGNYNNKVIATDQNWSGVFGGTGLINVDVSNLDTRNITNMSGLFEDSYELETVGDLSQWNTSNVTNMSHLFSWSGHSDPFLWSGGNSQLSNVGDLSKWDTRSVTDMSYMFWGSSIVPGNIGNRNVSNVKDMSYMFLGSRIFPGNIGNWNVSNVEDMRGMFDGSAGHIGDLSHWDTSNVTNMSEMFYGSSISVSGLTHWNTKNVMNMTGMFEDSGLPYKIVAANESSIAILPNQVTLKDNTGKVLAIIDTPTIYDSNKSVRSTIDGIVQSEIDKLNKLNHTSYETPKIISDGDDDYSIANATYVVTTLANNEVPYDSTTISNNVNANYGYLDSYKLTENNQGQAQLIASGWHATGASNSDRYRYMIVFDNTLGHEIARQKLVPQVRSDVQRAYPNVDNSLYSGFNITIDIPNSSINHSLSLVARYSNDPNNGEGARVDYWFNSLALNEDNQAYLDKLSANGDTLTVTGWHATNQAAGRPYHYIIAWDQNLGHEIARQKVTVVNRPDVANVYKTVANAVNSGFSVNFNLTPQFFNDNIQFISRWTDDAAGNGNAVDYWFKPMNRTNRANLDSVTLSNGQLQVAGWHATDLSQLEPNHYLIVFDNTTGQQVASEKVGLQSSQDVKNVFGDIQTANHSRFNYAFNSLHLISGHNYSLVSRYSADANGNGNDGAHTDSWLNMGTFQQSAYSIDHVALNRRHMTVQGWVANDNAMTRPYAYAILLQNGHEIGRQRLNLSERADVAKVYPQIYRSQYSGFNTSFDLPTASTNGLQLVLRFTDDPAGNGNSSDKWINL